MSINTLKTGMSLASMILTIRRKIAQPVYQILIQVVVSVETLRIGFAIRVTLVVAADITAIC